MNDKLKEMLIDWNDPLGYRTVPDAEDLICELQIEIGGKDELIKTLKDELKYYKDLADEYIKNLNK